MTKQQIFNALNSDWWLLSPSNSWLTQFVSTIILFDTQALDNCTYTSSAPYQNTGLNTADSNWYDYLNDLIYRLMVEASQRLFDMGCTNVVGNQNLSYQFGAQS